MIYQEASVVVCSEVILRYLRKPKVLLKVISTTDMILWVRDLGIRKGKNPRSMPLWVTLGRKISYVCMFTFQNVWELL